MKKLALLLLAFALPAAAALPGPTSASFAKGVPFTVSGYTGNETLSGFPVLVRLAEDSPAGFSYNDVTNRAAADKNEIDLAFVDMSGNGLPFEIDTWDTNGTSLVWVRLPTMASGTQFVMCWGSSSPGKAVCNDNPWSDYAGVWHMNDPGDGATNVCDSTVHHLDGRTVATSASKTDGKIGKARLITTNTSNAAGSPYDSGITVDLASDAAKKAVVDALVPEFTVSMWIRPQNGTEYSNYNFLVARRGSDKGAGWGAQFDAKDNKYSPIRVYSAAETDDNKDNRGDPANKKVVTAAVSGIVYQQWHKVDIVWTADAKYAIYVDGVQKATGALTRDAAANGDVANLSLGGSLAPLNANDKTGRGFYGDMDEFRIRPGTNSLAWIAADYAQQSGTSLLTAGTVEPYVETSDPVAGVMVSAVAYTNATVTANVSKRGTGASTADVTVQLSTTPDFAAPCWTTNYVVQADGDVQSFLLTGLSTNTSYWVRAAVTNSVGAGLLTGVSTFTTLVPGAPSGTATFGECGFTTMTASATAASFGTGAQSATMYLQASKTTDFATVVSGTAVSAALGEAATLSVSGLEPGTNYNLRVRIRNDWGLETFVPLPDNATLSVPFSTTGIGWTFSQDGSTVDVTFGVSGVYDGATGTATLYYGASPNPTESMGSRPVTATGDLTWAALPASASTMYAKVVLSATLAGTTYSQTYTAPLTAGSSSITVSDIAAHMSSATALRVRPGDVVTLPELRGAASYTVGNRLFGSIEGNVLTALRPGILGVRCATPDGATTNTMAVLVLPDRIEGGDIYIHKEGTSTWGNWWDSGRWEKLGSETNDSYPHNTNDIAIVAYYADSAVLGLKDDLDTVLGELYIGGYTDINVSRGLRYGSRGYLSFARTDGKPARYQLCSNTATANRQVNPPFNDFGVRFTVDTVLSGGWDGTSSSTTRGRFSFNGPSIEIPDGVMVTLVEMDNRDGNKGARLELGGFVGGGTFWNRSCATIRFNYNAKPMSAFTGLLRDSGYGSSDDYCVGPLQIRMPTATNCLVEVVGFVGSDNGSDPARSFRPGVGAFVTGYDNNYQNSPVHVSTNWFPRRGVSMHGGLLWCKPEFSQGNNVWPAGSFDRRTTDSLVFSNGFVQILQTLNGGGSGHPATWFQADSILHENKATLLVRDPSRYETASTAQNTNAVTVLHGIASHAVGAGGNCETSPAHAIVPWIVAPTASKDNDKTLLFACFDGADRLVRPGLSSAELSAWNDGDNAVVKSEGTSGLALQADRTLNSLVLDSSSFSEAGRRLGEGRTLAISSGGLLFSDSGSTIGTPGGGTQNGTLALGDADRPAYVWSRAARESPSEIWAKIEAPGGFVAAYTGTLVLGGDQTGIGDELVVNAGTLQLGTASSACRFAKDLPVRVYANATLLLPNASSLGGKLLRFDGAAGWFGKVEIADGVAAKCKMAFVRDYPDSPDWRTLPRGVYGSSASAATDEFVRDDLFSGGGTLEVVSDDRIRPTLMILR